MESEEQAQMVVMNVYVLVAFGLVQKKLVKTPKKIEKNQNKILMTKNHIKKVVKRAVEHGPKIGKYVIGLNYQSKMLGNYYTWSPNI